MTPLDLRVRDGVERGAPIRFTFDGRAIDAYEGESVAAALWAAGVRSGGPADGDDERRRHRRIARCSA